MITEIIAPTTCPDCQQPITEFIEPQSEIVTHWCRNDECPGRIADMLEFVGKREQLEIEGLGPETCALLAKNRYVVTLADLFAFCNDLQTKLAEIGVEQLSEKLRKRGLPAAAMLKMVEGCHNAKTASWDRWIAALGIPGIGLSMGKALAKATGLTSEDMQGLPAVFNLDNSQVQIEGFGFRKRAEVTRAATDSRFVEMCARLYEAGVRPAAIEVPEVVENASLTSMVFCITGEFYEIGSREFITAQLTRLGATSKSGVSDKLTHLLVGTEAGKTKLNKAEEINLKRAKKGAAPIQLCDETWLTNTLQANGVKPTGADLNMEWAD